MQYKAICIHSYLFNFFSKDLMQVLLNPKISKCAAQHQRLKPIIFYCLIISNCHQMFIISNYHQNSTLYIKDAIFCFYVIPCANTKVKIKKCICCYSNCYQMTKVYFFHLQLKLKSMPRYFSVFLCYSVCSLFSFDTYILYSMLIVSIYSFSLIHQ